MEGGRKRVEIGKREEGKEGSLAVMLPSSRPQSFEGDWGPRGTLKLPPQRHPPPPRGAGGAQRLKHSIRQTHTPPCLPPRNPNFVLRLTREQPKSPYFRSWGFALIHSP